MREDQGLRNGRQPGTNDRKVVVCPPTPQRIEQYTRAVCRALSENHGQEYCNPDVVAGFTAFVKLVVRIRARQLGATDDEKGAEQQAA